MPQDKTITKVSPPFQDKLLNPETGYMSRPWELYFLRLPLTLGGSDTRLTTAEANIATNAADIATIENQIDFYGVVADSSTTTGTVEEVLATVTLPVGAMLEASRFYSVELDAFVVTANNANTKTVRMRIGGLTGALAGSRDDANPANEITLSTRLFKTFDGTYDWAGIGMTARTTGVTAVFPEPVAAGAVTYTGAIDIVLTGETPTAAGDITLVNFVVKLRAGNTDANEGQAGDLQDFFAALDMTDVASTVSHPDTLTVVAGTLNSGTVADVATIGGNLVDVQEVVAAPGWDIIFDWSGASGIPRFGRVLGYYAGGANHAPVMQAYDYTAAAWVTLETFYDMTGIHSFSFPSNGSFISSGAMRLRFYHASLGNALHQMLIDYVEIAMWKS